MTLRPSISRAISATQDDLLESAEAKDAMVYGSPTPERTAWLDTFLSVAPSRDVAEMPRLVCVNCSETNDVAGKYCESHEAPLGFHLFAELV